MVVKLEDFMYQALLEMPRSVKFANFAEPFRPGVENLRLSMRYSEPMYSTPLGSFDEVLCTRVKRHPNLKVTPCKKGSGTAKVFFGGGEEPG